MTFTPAQGIGLALVLVTATLFLLIVRRLRAVPVRSLRSKWLGAVVPVAATAAYLVLAVPPFNVVVLIGGSIAGLVLGALLARSGGRPLKPDSHQRGLSLLLWAIVYLLAVASGLTAYGGLQAVAAVAVVSAAGFALGAQVGVLVRPRSSGTGQAPVVLAAVIGLLLIAGPSVGGARAEGIPPDPCVFMDVTIWPGDILEDPGIQRGGEVSAPSCTARFAYDVDEAGFVLVGELTVIRFPSAAEARSSVEGAGAVFGNTVVELGDGGLEGIYVENFKQLYVAYFSVDNFVGWVKGQAYSSQRIVQGRAAAGRLAALMESVIRPPAPPSPSPGPSDSPGPVLPSAAPSVLPSAAPSAAPSPVATGPAPTPAAPSPEPSVPATPGQLDPAAVLAGMQTLGETLTLGAQATAQNIEDTLRGIVAGALVLVAGLLLAGIGRGTTSGRSPKVPSQPSTPVEPLGAEDAPPAPVE